MYPALGTDLLKNMSSVLHKTVKKTTEAFNPLENISEAISKESTLTFKSRATMLTCILLKLQTGAPR